MITTLQLKTILPHIKLADMWVAQLEIGLAKLGLTSKEQIAMFIAQTGHESAQYNILEENLNYSQAGLIATFPKYFKTPEIAAEYARNQAKIASRVYANRLGNGDEASQDGWKYRGRGLIQCTGKSNYALCSQYVFGDDRLVNKPVGLTDPINAVLSACWFWDYRGLSSKTDIVQVTKAINGGTFGLDARKEIYDRALTIL